MNKKGLTLIEIIISVAILGIITILFLSIFSNEHRLIKDASNDTEDLIAEQEDVELALSNQRAGLAHDMVIAFPGNTISVPGVTIVEETFVNFHPGVSDTVIDVTGVSLSPSSIELTELGEARLLAETVYPTNATNQEVGWSSSNSNVTVENGVIRAVIEGSATITVTTDDGGYTDTTFVTVNVVAEDPNDDATLSLFQYKVDGSAVYIDVPGFPNEPANYDIHNIGYNLIDVRNVPTDPNASTVPPSGQINFSSGGKYVHTITVTAEDGITEKTYTVTFWKN
ncbi:MAG: Ig-like domain-containing protein [Clostridiales bacterium]|nr:Ig-like domain-containing protein [Clostridiales bacterium]